MGFYLAGATQSTNGDITYNHSHPGLHDIWLVKLSGDGELQFQQCFGGDRDEYIESGVLYKGNNKFIMAGQTEKVSGDVLCDFHGWQEKDDYWVFEITMEDTTTITNPYNEQGFRVFPNPANEYVIFELQDTRYKMQDAWIIITNIFGQEVMRIPLIQEKTVWDTRKINSGVYFYSITVNGINESGKIVVSK